VGSRRYTRPAVPRKWAASHRTHPAVAVAIHAIATRRRSPQAIWKAPTPAEWQRVTVAVAEYVNHGDFPREADGRYPWASQFISVTAVDPRVIYRCARFRSVGAFEYQADFSDADSKITVCLAGSDHWLPTPYRVGDVHDRRDAEKLIANYLVGIVSRRR
jgi:hypothetical protein